MKNVMVIDGATNCAYDIFGVPEDDFKKVFQAKDQNIEFIEDIEKSDRYGSVKGILSKMWKNPVKKEKANGIHGILFFQLENKKHYYPNKKDEDLDFNGRAFSAKDL